VNNQTCRDICIETSRELYKIPGGLANQIG